MFLLRHWHRSTTLFALTRRNPTRNGRRYLLLVGSLAKRFLITQCIAHGNLCESCTAAPEGAVHAFRISSFHPARWFITSCVLTAPFFFLEPINRGLSVPAYPLINLPLTRAWHVFWATDACCHSSPPLPDRNPIPIALSDYLSACRFAVSERNFREQRSSCACPEIDGGQRSDQSFPSKARRNGTTKKFPFEEQ